MLSSNWGTIRDSCYDDRLRKIDILRPLGLIVAKVGSGS